MTEPAAGDPNKKPDDMAEAAELAADTLGRDLLQALVNELLGCKVAWADLSEADQNASIERLRHRVHKLVGEALSVVLLQQYPVCVATVAGVRFKKGITVALSVDKHAQSRHELADAEGKSVLVLIADPDELRQNLSMVRAAAKQGDLFTGDGGVAMGENYIGGDARPFRRDEPGIGTEDPPTAGDLELAAEPDQPHAFVGDETTGKELCRICSKPVEDPVHTTPQAPPDLALEPDPLWKQAVAALASVNVEVDEAAAQGWTPDQCTEAQFFVTLLRDAKGKTVKMPKFVHKALLSSKATRKPPEDTQ